VSADLASIVTGNTALERDLTAISVEDSKFLGGDVEHTHLVKGLDYALLQKVGGSHLPGSAARPAPSPIIVIIRACIWMKCV
jgi:hypothetical protein